MEVYNVYGNLWPLLLFLHGENAQLLGKKCFDIDCSILKHSVNNWPPLKITEILLKGIKPDETNFVIGFSYDIIMCVKNE